MSRMRLNEYYILKIFVDDFMRNSNFGIGVPNLTFCMLKSNIDVFFVTSFLCSLKFLLFHRIEYPKRCL